MDISSAGLDLSGVDPVDVVLLVARKGGVAVPDDARPWLAAARPAPLAEVEAYARFLADVRAVELRDVILAALEAALAGARADTRLAELLGRPAPSDPDGGGTAVERGAEGDGPAGDEEPGDVSDGGGRDAAGDDAGDWYEAPAGDAITAVLTVAGRAGIPVPGDARAWLSDPTPAPFDEAWPYRSLLTALAVTPVPPEVGTAIDDALARARAGGGRLAELLGGTTSDRGDVAGPVVAVPSGRRPEAPGRWRPAWSALRRRSGAAVPSRRRRPRPRVALGRRVGLTLLALTVAAVAAWVIVGIAPRVGDHLPAFDPGGPDPASADGPLADGAVADRSALASADAEQLVDDVVRAGDAGWPSATDGVRRRSFRGRAGVDATVTTLRVDDVAVDGGWRPPDDVRAVVVGLAAQDRRGWTLAADTLAPPAGATFALRGTGEAVDAVRHGRETVTGPVDGRTQRWLVVPTDGRPVAVVLDVPSTASDAPPAAEAAWLSDAAAALLRGGNDREAVVAWIAGVLADGPDAG
jgi:hypothetical protein